MRTHAPTSTLRLIQGGGGIEGGTEDGADQPVDKQTDKLSHIIGGIQQRFLTFVQGNIFMKLETAGMQIQKMASDFYLRKNDPDILIDKIQQWINGILEEAGRTDELHIQVKRKEVQPSEYRGLYSRIEKMQKQRGNMRFRVYVRKDDMNKTCTVQEIEKIIAPQGVKKNAVGIVGNILEDIFGEKEKVSLIDFLKGRFSKADIAEK